MDVAGDAGVSTATVSRVLAGGATVAPETRARVLDSVERLGYRPNTIARALRSGRGRSVALATGDIEQWFRHIGSMRAEPGAATADQEDTLTNVHGNALIVQG